MAMVIDMPYQPDWVDYLSAGLRNIGRAIAEEKKRKRQKEAMQEAIYSIIKQSDEYGEFEPTIRIDSRGNIIYTFKPKDRIKEIGNRIKEKIIRSEPLTKEETNYYNKFMAPSIYREPIDILSSADEKPSKKPSLPPTPVGKFNPLRLLPHYAYYGKDIRSAYNALRARGISPEEAKRRLGIK